MNVWEGPVTALITKVGIASRYQFILTPKHFNKQSLLTAILPKSTMPASTRLTIVSAARIPQEHCLSTSATGLYLSMSSIRITRITRWSIRAPIGHSPVSAAGNTFGYWCANPSTRALRSQTKKTKEADWKWMRSLDADWAQSIQATIICTKPSREVKAAPHKRRSESFKKTIKKYLSLNFF